MQPWQINQQASQQAQQASQRASDQARRDMQSAQRAAEQSRLMGQHRPTQAYRPRVGRGPVSRGIGTLLRLAVLAALIYGGYRLYRGG
jgi:hypothetical protein